MDSISLEDKVVLVTGAAGGFGRRTSLDLAKAGARVVATDLDGEGAAETARLCRQHGRAAWGHAHDVTRADDWERIVAATARDADGRLDALVNNAGRMLTRAFLRTSVEELRSLLAVNLESVWIGSQAAYPLLAATARARGAASIVNVSSVFGQVGAIAQSAYAAAKGGITVLTKSVAAEFARSGCGVRVNSVHPGPGNTPLLANGLRELIEEGLVPSPQDARTLALNLIPAGRLAEPADVSHMILFLCSDLSSYLTGAEFTVDGGYTAV